MKLYLSPYQDGDLEKFVPRPDMSDDLRATTWNWAEGPPPGRTWTLMRPGVGGEVLGIGGLVDRGGGHFDAWAVLAPLQRRDWPGAFAQARRILHSAFGLMGAKTVEASAHADRPEAVALLRKLGFEQLYIGLDGRLRPPALMVFMQRKAA